MKIIKLRPVFAVVAIALAVFAIAKRKPEGIHPISDTAIYVAGEACTVEMQLDRSLESITSDFDGCLKLHAKYKRAVLFANRSETSSTARTASVASSSVATATARMSLE
jgi:hypothetical protein